MKTLFDRLLAETSPFFKGVQVFVVAALIFINALSAFLPM